MNQKVIIQYSVNLTPEDRINDCLKKLGKGWRIISATTAMCPYGVFDEENTITGLAPGSARHVYFVTTVVVEKT